MLKKIFLLITKHNVVIAMKNKNLKNYFCIIHIIEECKNLILGNLP